MAKPPPGPREWTVLPHDAIEKLSENLWRVRGSVPRMSLKRVMTIACDPLGFIFTTLLGSAPGPRVSRLFRRAVVEDRAALRADLQRLATLPDLARLIVAHENLAAGPQAAEALRKAATYL